METLRAEQMTIEAELVAPGATVRVTRFDVPPGEGELPRDADCRLDLSLTPRAPNARISFRDRWSAHRFERPGKVFLVPPGEALRARTDGGRQASVVCMLHPDAIRRWLERDIGWSNRLIEASFDIPGTCMPALLMRLGEEARHPGFASAALCEAFAMQIAVELGRYYCGIEEGVQAGGLPPWRLRLIEERLRDGPDTPTLSALAMLCGLSVRQLTRGFRASRGRSIGEHIAARRIDRARDLLGGGKSVKSIAYAMGFRSPSSFCHAFRKATGQTPQQYRQHVLA